MSSIYIRIHEASHNTGNLIRIRINITANFSIVVYKVVQYKNCWVQALQGAALTRYVVMWFSAYLTLFLTTRELPVPLLNLLYNNFHIALIRFRTEQK